jgi:hypothetical protein
MICVDETVQPRMQIQKKNKLSKEKVCTAYVSQF